MATRHERVVLTLDDDFSTGMARAAAATKLLDRSLGDLSGSEVNTSRTTTTLVRDNDRLTRSMDDGGKTIDRYSGRLGLLVKTASVLGPSLAPISAVAVAGVGVLASQLGFAAVGMSALVVAAQGVGDAIKAVDKAQLEPTVENLEAARDALRDLDPAAQAFVSRFQDFQPVLTEIRNSAAAGFFPGLTESLDDFERIAPKVGEILKAVGAVGGSLIADAAEELAGPEWSEFMDFIAREAPPALAAMGRSVGNVAKGMAHLWQAFDPLNDDFSQWMLDGARGFERWADGLAETEGFEEFVAYVRENGPTVADTTVAIANAVLQIGEAAAPLGGPVLEAITKIAEAIAAIADSPLGTPIMAAVTAMSALSLASKAATAAVTATNAALLRVGVTSKSLSAASTKGVGGGGIAGMLAGIFAIEETLEDIGEIRSGEKSPFENLLENITPGRLALEAFGVEVNDIDNKLRHLWNNTSAEPFLRDLAEAAMDGGDGFRALASSAGRVRSETTRLAPVLRRVARAMRDQADSAKQADKLTEALKEQRAAVSATADLWTDYSQKVKLATGPDIETLTRRWERLGEASANMASNIREAVREGLDPKIIKDVIDTLGPQGAALALEEFANASGAEAKRIESSFRRMSRGTRDFRDAYDGLAGLVSGNGLSFGVEKQSKQIVSAAARARAAVLGIPTKHETDIKEKGAAEVAAAAARARSSVTAIPDRWHTAFGESGAAAVAAAAARARAAVTSIPQSWTSTITVRKVGAGIEFASGGYTGDGRKDEPAGVVHRGEVVIPQELVRRDWSMLSSRYGHLPGFDGGGMVTAPMLTRGDDSTSRESRETGRALKALRAELKETTKALEKERAERDKIIDRMKTLGSDVRGGLRSDLFGEVNPWETKYGGTSPAGVMGTLRSDLGEARKMRQAIKRLRAKGLTGPALAAVLSQGGLEGALAFAELPRSELREYAELYNRRNRVLRSVGQQAGNAAYGAQLRESNRDVRELKQEVKQIKHLLAKGNKDRKDEHGKDRDAQRRGAGNGQRNRRRDR